MVDVYIITVLVLTEVTRGHLADSPEVVHHLPGLAVDSGGTPHGAIATAHVSAFFVPGALVAEGEDALCLAALAVPTTGISTVSRKVQGI